MDLTTVIETRPGVRSGKPCFIGTGIAVYDVLDYLASGMTTEEIVADFAELTSDHVRAALEFAALRERRRRRWRGQGRCYSHSAKFLRAVQVPPACLMAVSVAKR